MRDYAVYKGDDLLMVGNVHEVSKFTGMSENVIWSTVHHRAGQEPKREKTYHFVVVDDKEEEEDGK